MLKKVLLAGTIVVVVAILGGLLWARSILATESVRAAIAAQVSEAIGQPVSIGGIGATVFPRVTVTLEQVAIGQPPRILVATLHIGTSAAGLLSRRIEHGAVHLSGARIELPLPPLGRPSPATQSPAPDGPIGTARPVEIVSIDEIVLSDVEIVSGGRRLRGDIEAVLEGNGVELRKIELVGDDTTITATGRITDLSAPTGELTLKAGALNVDRLLAFAGDFAGGSAAPTAPGATEPAVRQVDREPTALARPAMNIIVSVAADRATMGALTIDNLTGRARLTPQAVVVEPIGFGLFGGRYEGTLAVDTSDALPAFRWTATLAGVDVAAAAAFAGSPDTISGRLSGAINLAGAGSDAATAIKTARGTARVDILDGVVKRLGLVRNVVVATSMREGAIKQAAAGGSTDEPFTRLGATLRIASGTATTDDLHFESKDLLLNARGSIRLDAAAVDLAGRVHLSEELSKQAGSDLTRYTAEQGRVTLPATISGPVDNLSVRIDVAEAARRALTNRAAEEAQKRLKGGLGGLLRRP